MHMRDSGMAPDGNEANASTVGPYGQHAAPAMDPAAAAPVVVQGTVVQGTPVVAAPTVSLIDREAMDAAVGKWSSGRVQVNGCISFSADFEFHARAGDVYPTSSDVKVMCCGTCITLARVGSAGEMAADGSKQR